MRHIRTLGLAAIAALAGCAGTPAQQVEQWDATACAFQAAANNFAEAKKNDVNAVALANVVSATAGTMCIPLVAAPAVAK